MDFPFSVSTFLQLLVAVAMPPFTKGRKQFTKLQVEKTKTISRARIHIERAIMVVLKEN